MGTMTRRLAGQVDRHMVRFSEIEKLAIGRGANDSCISAGIGTKVASKGRRNRFNKLIADRRGERRQPALAFR